MLELFASVTFWKHASIPVVAGVIGWGTNWLAIRMTFEPLEFIGFYRPWLGWQGIIPSKARKMASIAVDSTLAKLGTLREVVDAMEPERIAAHVVRTIEPRIGEQIEEVMREEYGVLWDNAPEMARRAVVDRARHQLPRLVARLMDDIAGRVEDLLDLERMVVEQLERDKRLLNRMFLECGEAELRFIVRSGLYFGVPFGLVQLAVWIVYPAWWVLPFFGLLVGLATNWIALNVIFRPLEPVGMGPIVMQGLFLKRQREVAGVWCRLVTREILTLRIISDAMLNGPKARATRTLIRKHVRAIVTEAAGSVTPFVRLAAGEEKVTRLKDLISERAIEISARPFDDPAFNEESATRVERLMRERMEAMTPAEFQELLRPAFQEDEWKLIVVGGALGMAAGIAQLVFVF